MKIQFGGERHPVTSVFCSTLGDLKPSSFSMTGKINKLMTLATGPEFQLITHSDTFDLITSQKQKETLHKFIGEAKPDVHISGTKIKDGYGNEKIKVSEIRKVMTFAVSDTFESSEKPKSKL